MARCGSTAFIAGTVIHSDPEAQFNNNSSISLNVGLIAYRGKMQSATKCYQS